MHSMSDHTVNNNSSEHNNNNNYNYNKFNSDNNSEKDMNYLQNQVKKLQKLLLGEQG
jgi:hypothetical protein